MPLEKRQSLVIFVLVIVAILGQSLIAVDAPAMGIPKSKAGMKETKAERDNRMRWWREARFGMFIHWGQSIKRVRLMTDPKHVLKFGQTGATITIQVPGKALDPVSSVIVVETNVN